MFPPEDELEISPQQVSELLASAAGTFDLIDCREEDEFALCKIEQASLVPLSDFVAMSAGFLDDLERPLIVYCHHGMRSQQAAMFLRQRGAKKAYSMAGGIEQWSLEIDSTVPRY